VLRPGAGAARNPQAWGIKNDEPPASRQREDNVMITLLQTAVPMVVAMVAVSVPMVGARVIAGKHR
jgi:hypothetical protein